MIYVLYDCVCVPTDFVYIVVRVLILPFGTFNDLISSFLSVFAVDLLTTREWPHIQLPRTDTGVCADTQHGLKKDSSQTEGFGRALAIPLSVSPSAPGPPVTTRPLQPWIVFSS